MKSILNIAAYKFVALDDLSRWRHALRQFCREQDLKGTILLTPEGINLFIAGRESNVRSLLDYLRGYCELSDLEAKESWCEQVPFRRMLVKIKREIIAFGQAGIAPAESTSPKIAPRDLKAWLDEGRSVTLLDVRNDYEVQLGAFSNALPIGIDDFRHFPPAVRRLPERLKQQPVVMYCTGGIRCEKAGPWMEREGFSEVYQLDGGILKYFEECGGDHYEGECFVFDQRVALDAHLRETDTTQCFACQAPLSPEDQQSPRFVVGQSCPHCFQTPAEQMARTIKRRQEAIREIVQPLPGSLPYVNHRPIHISRKHDGLKILDVVDDQYPFVGRQSWQERFELGMIFDGEEPISYRRTVYAGECFDHRFPETVEPDVNGDIGILYEDDSLVAVHKPAPLPMHPCGRYNRNTLNYILNRAYRPQRLRLAHRLDANTSGVVVFSRSRAVAAKVQPQFARLEVEKHYLARVLGQPPHDHFACGMPISTVSMPAGARTVAEEGQTALTDFRVLARCEDGSALVEVMPRTGRTNQIRIHLWHLGFPICGDPMYVSGGEINSRQTLEVDAPCLCLHAWQIELNHPADNRRIRFTAPPPTWANR